MKDDQICPEDVYCIHLCMYTYIHTFLYVPGSSRYVKKILPVGRFSWVKRHKNFTHLEDPGIIYMIYKYIYAYIYICI